MMLVVTDSAFLKSKVKGHYRSGHWVDTYTTKVVKQFSVAGLPSLKQAVIKDALADGFQVKESADFIRVWKTIQGDAGKFKAIGLTIYPDETAVSMSSPGGKNGMDAASQWRAAIGLPSHNPVPKTHQGDLFGGGQKLNAPQYGLSGKPGAFAGGAGWQPKQPPKPKTFHPKADDHGERVGIYDPHIPTDMPAWNDPTETVTVTPGHAVPSELHGVPFAPWVPPADEQGWEIVDGQADIDEPAMSVPEGKNPGSGCLMIEPDGRVWMVSPTNGFGGHRNTFPKGKLDDGDLSFQANAIKETFEESGLKAEVIAFLGDFERSTSVTRYYIARRVGGSPADAGWESQAAHLAPIDKVEKMATNPADKPVVAALRYYLEFHRE